MNYNLEKGRESMEKEELDYITVDTTDLEMQNGAFVDTMLVDTPDRVMADEMPMGEEAKSGVSTHVILYIVIGICAIVGIALGILAGRRAAYK